MSVPFSAHLDAASNVLKVSGTIDRHHLTRLDAFLLLMRRGGTVDLSEVTYLPGAAVNKLAQARTRATQEGMQLQLTADPGSIAETILRVTGLLAR